MNNANNETHTQTAFIRILRDYLLNRKIDDYTADWNELLRLSKLHEVTGIIQHQCKAFIPENLRSEFETTYSATLFYYSNRVRAMQFISDLLNQNSIPFFSVKGLEVAKYYPFPALRTMGDNDVVVELGKLLEAVAILKEHGFVRSADPGDSGEHVWSCDYKKLHFEFHDRLTDNDARTGEQQIFFNDFMPYVKDNTLDWNFHFLFLIMHLRKHFMNSGVGLRQFMDIAVVAKNREDLDWDWIEEKLIELKLQKFAHACYSLIEDWFDITVPVQYKKLEADLTDEVTEKIVNNGVFGFADEDNKDNRVSNILIQSGESIRKNRLTFLICSLFPSYENMKGYPGCGFLDGRPYLLPIAWIRRFVYILGKNDNIDRTRTIAGSFKSTADLEKRRELLKQMGVLDE